MPTTWHKRRKKTLSNLSAVDAERPGHDRFAVSTLA
jgi:hypothetical protein